jgi:hypothetical protein
MVAAGQVAVCKINSFVPRVSISEDGTQAQMDIQSKVGTIVVQTLPVECTISIPGLAIVDQKKTKVLWKATAVPAGSHTIILSALGKTIETALELAANDTAEIMVNFMTGQVLDMKRETLRRSATEETDIDTKVQKLQAYLELYPADPDAAKLLKTSMATQEAEKKKRESRDKATLEDARTLYITALSEAKKFEQAGKFKEALTAARRARESGWSNVADVVAMITRVRPKIMWRMRRCRIDRPWRWREARDGVYCARELHHGQPEKREGPQ